MDSATRLDQWTTEGRRRPSEFSVYARVIERYITTQLCSTVLIGPTGAAAIEVKEACKLHLDGIDLLL